jgi:5-methylcytosine-specific restriction protein A
MLIPQLIFNARDREYKRYNSYLRSQVVKEFLFSQSAYRALDNAIFNLSGNSNRGFESWSILNYLGLNDSFKGLFFEQDLYKGIDLLEGDTQDFALILFHLNYQTTIEEQRSDFQQKIEDSQDMSLNERVEQIADSVSDIPKLKKEIIYSYSRSPHVVAQALFRAQGKCEKCRENAPFLRKSNGTPYLEVHHKIPLSEQNNNDSSLDTLENVLALCPNCHRKAHFGLTLDFI